jgi:SAM-dependent methyltransferase
MSQSDRGEVSRREARDRALFERVAADYHRKDLLPAHRHARRYRLLQSLRHVELPSNCSILEVGCGAGFAADYLRGRYGQFLGIDYSQELIGYARKHNAWNGVRFEVANVNDFESKQKFDLILMIGLLHHLDDPEAILRNMSGYLKPGRWILVQYSQKQLTDMFHSAGLSDVQVMPQGLFSTPLAEVALPFQGLLAPISTGLCALDGVIERCVGGSLAWPFWNLIVAGRHPLSKPINRS